MAKLTELEKKCGRLIVGRLPGLDLPTEFAQDLASGGLGGITLFRENCDSIEQLAKVIGSIYEKSMHVPVVTADQEGGAVQRFCPALSSMPSHMSYAACPDRDLVKDVMLSSFLQLKLLGLNFVLSPVLDVVTNIANPIVSTRSFGSMPGIVERNAKELIDLINQAGLIGCGKHFPGHGATLEDSHVALAVSDVDSDRLWNVDLAPFKNCLNDLPAILTGHIWLKCVDEEPLPASLSGRVTNGILREYLNYDGLIVTDDMTMQGLASSSKLEDACVEAVVAGADLLLVCGDIDKSRSSREALVKAVKDGVIDEVRIDSSLKRLDKLFSSKPNLDELAYKNPKVLNELIENVASTNEKRNLSANATTTLLKGEFSGMENTEWVVVAPNHPRYDLDVFKYLKDFCDAKYGDGEVKLEEIRYTVNPEFEENKEISHKVKGKSCIFVTFRCLINEGQMQLGQMIADQVNDKRKIAIVTDTPFDFSGLPDWPTVIATFDPSDVAIQSLSNVMVQSEVSSKASSYFSRLVEGVSVINRNKVIQ